MKRFNPVVERNKIGVFPIGALSISFYDRLGADYIICSKRSVTTAWALTFGWIRINGERRDVGENLLDGFVNSPDGSPNLLPEIILVSPYADKLKDFLDQLFEYLKLLDEMELYELESVPKFLLASSGIYFENVVTGAQDRIESSFLKNKSFFTDAIERRIFRAVAINRQCGWVKALKPSTSPAERHLFWCSREMGKSRTGRESWSL